MTAGVSGSLVAAHMPDNEMGYLTRSPAAQTRLLLPKQ